MSTYCQHIISYWNSEKERIGDYSHQYGLLNQIIIVFFHPGGTISIARMENFALQKNRGLFLKPLQFSTDF